MLRRHIFERLANFALCAVTDRHPGIFARLGVHAGRRYLIDVTDTPFALLLLPRERRLEVWERSSGVTADAVIRGTFLTLLRLAQGEGDGDALFFSRDLAIEGDTEAVLALRNALDDADVDVVDEALQALGRPAAPLRLGYRALRDVRPIISGMFAP